MKTFLLGYLCFLNVLALIFGTAFMMGVAKQSLNMNHTGSAALIVIVWWSIVPLIGCAVVMCGQSFAELLAKRRTP